MKKVSFLVAALAVSALSVNAQKAYEGTRFLDNWYVGVKGGVTTPTTHSAFWPNMRAETGIELGKQITPVLGVSFEGLTGINTSFSKTAFDDLNLGVLGKINLNNLFGGYNGEPRLFEVEGIAGFGWGHDFVNSSMGADRSYMVSRFGASFNFNLGEKKAWAVNVRPAIVYRMDGDRAQQLNVNKSKIEILAGVTYRFASSNGKHYMTIQKPYNQAEVNSLNEAINALRAENARKDEALGAKDAENARLEKELTDLRNATKQIETIIQKSTVSIKGYASPEGSAEVNARVAKQRAEAVKNMLISKYKISASRITAEGQGVGSMFSEPDWNRVSIATLSESE